MEFNEVLNRRYSCRAFAAQGVEQEKVDRILETGGGVGDAGLLIHDFEVVQQRLVLVLGSMAGV